MVIVKELSGRVLAQALDGSIKSLKVGNEVATTDKIITKRGNVVLVNENNELLEIGKDQVVQIDNNVFTSESSPTAVDSSLEATTARTVLDSLEGDLLENLDATAAGLGAGGEGGGNSFVQLLRVTEQVSPQSFKYSFNGLSAQDLEVGSIDTLVDTTTEPPVEPPVDKDKNNNGHGNNTDGQDDNNPGQGGGGPNSEPKDGEDEDEGNQGNQGDTTPGAGQNNESNHPNNPTDETTEDESYRPSNDSDPSDPNNLDDDKSESDLNDRDPSNDGSGNTSEPTDTSSPDDTNNNASPNDDTDVPSNHPVEDEPERPDEPSEETSDNPNESNNVPESTDNDGSGSSSDQVEDVVDDEVDTKHANNGWGNGDQDAPGNSLDNNNAENSTAINPLDLLNDSEEDILPTNNGKGPSILDLNNPMDTVLDILKTNNGHHGD